MLFELNVCYLVRVAIENQYSQVLSFVEGNLNFLVQATLDGFLNVPVG